MWEDPDPKEPTDELDDTPGGDEADEGAGEGEHDESDGAEGGDGEGSEDSSDADAGTSEDGGEVEDEGEAEPPARRSASDVIRANKKARKAEAARAAEADRKAEEALRRAEAAERRAEEAERRANERRQQESDRAEAERLELMTESEKIDHFRRKDAEAHKREIDGVKFQIWDSTDRTEFRQLVREDPLVAAVRTEVETEFERLKAAGRPVSREILANQFIARKAREGRLKAGTEQRQRAAAGVRRQTVKPPRTRSDVAGGRQRRGEGDSKEARRERLKDVIL